MITPKHRHLIWDWNGTLLDDAWLCIRTMNRVLARRNLPDLTAQRYQEIFGFPVIDYYRKLPFDEKRDPFEEISTEFIQGYEDARAECRLRNGAVPALERAAELGLTQTVISSSKQPYLEDAVEPFGIRHLFSGLHGLDNHHASGKTTVARRWMARKSVDPAAVLLIGDTLHDLEVAQAIGVDCVLIFSGHQSIERLRGNGARVIDSLGQLFR